MPLDILPRVIEMDTWSVIERGVQQRVRALEAFLADVYDAGRVFDDGVIPRGVITTSSHFHREAAGVRPPNGVRVHVSGIDLIRDNHGEFRVLEDNVRVPSGVSYVMTNRRAISAALPETTAQHRIRPVAGYPQRLLGALRAAAPAGVTDPTVVVLTPGVYNGAYFEHALLARTMGVELVEGRDLVCRRGEVMMRTTKGLAPVHVIYRRIDDEYLDPVHFRADSMLGCPGMIDAARAGNVTLANAVGNGVADDKLVYTYLPDIIRYYLAEEPVLRNVDTWRMGDADAREEVLDRLDELVLKPVDGSGGKGIVIGPHATPGRARRPPGEGAPGPAGVDRPARRPAVDGADVRRRRARAAARRPAAVRGQRRRAGLGAAGWPDPGRARQGRADRELLPRRRHQGHLGARGPGRPGQPDARRRAARRRARAVSRTVPSDAEPDRGVDVLDRSLRRARRGHRADPRRTDPAAARGRCGRRVADLPRPAADHGDRAGRRGDPVGRRHHGHGQPRPGAAAARLQHQLGSLDRGGDRRRPRERAPGARDPLGAAVGGHQHHLPLDPVGTLRRAAAAVRLPVGARTRGPHQRHRRRDDDARRGLALPRCSAAASSART